LADNPQPADLKLTVSPLVRRGERIEASIDASNVTQTVVTLSAPDTVVISQPYTQVAGTGTFKQTVGWDVVHVQEGLSTWVEITASAGGLTQMGLCKVIG